MTGQLSGTPTSAQAATYSNVIIGVTDGQASASLAPFNIVVGASVSVGSASLTWSKPTVNDDGSPYSNLAGYKLYYGNSPGSLSQMINIPNANTQSYVVGNLASGVYYFAMSSYTAAAVESTRTGTVSLTIP
jgi:uncharacterized protein YqjF (DUF2071 family)